MRRRIFTRWVFSLSVMSVAASEGAENVDRDLVNRLLSLLSGLGDKAPIGKDVAPSVIYSSRSVLRGDVPPELEVAILILAVNGHWDFLNLTWFRTKHSYVRLLIISLYFSVNFHLLLEPEENQATDYEIIGNNFNDNEKKKRQKEFRSYLIHAPEIARILLPLIKDSITAKQANVLNRVAQRTDAEHASMLKMIDSSK